MFRAYKFKVSKRVLDHCGKLSPSQVNFLYWGMSRSLRRAHAFCFLLLIGCVASQSLNGQVGQEWERVLAAQGTDHGRAVTTDGFGNVYSAGGMHDGSHTYTVFRLNKYRVSGLLVWSRMISWTDGGNEEIGDVVCDQTGNVYVAGYYWGNSAWKTAVVKYDSSGTIVWDTTYDGKANNTPANVHLTLDESLGTLYLGTSVSAFTSNNHMTVYAIAMSSGTPVWSDAFAVYSKEILKNVVVDDSHNVYICGNAGSNYPYDDVILVAKYDSSGAMLWSDIYNPANSDMNEATDLSVDEQGNVFISGFNSLSGPSIRGIVVRYDASGNLRWTHVLSMTTNVFCTDVVTDTGGKVFLCGWQDGSSDYSFQECIDTASSSLWLRVDSTQTGYARAVQLLIGDDGNLYSRGGQEVMGYTKNGAYLWTWHIAAARSMTEMCNGGLGILYGTGDAAVIVGNDDFLTLKISDSTLIGVPDLVDHDNLKIFPNPTSSYLNATANLAENCSWELLDIQGRAIRAGILSGSTTIDLSGVAPGKYFFKVVEEGDHVLVEPFIIYE